VVSRTLLALLIGTFRFCTEAKRVRLFVSDV
jgi:hypothetical protein